MFRALLVVLVLVVVIGAILARLWTSGVPIRVALKMAALGAGFVVSVKMVLGGYLALRGDGEAELPQILGFYGSIVLALFFGVATLTLWRRGSSDPSSSRGGT